MLLIHSTILFLAVISLSYQIAPENKTVNISVKKETKNENEQIYVDRIELANQQSAIISVEGFDSRHFGFATLQIHSFYHNISIFDEKNQKVDCKSKGFILKPDNLPKTLRLLNENFDYITTLVSLIGYTNSAPQPAICSMEFNSTICMNSFDVFQREHFMALHLPESSEQGRTCENSELIYHTYYTYIDALNFDQDAYFSALEKMMFTGIFKSAYVAKKYDKTRTHLFEAISGRGLIVNTVVRKRNAEDLAFYVPYATYSCPPNTWLGHCSDITFLRRAISIVLVMHSVMMMLNLMSPDFIESILNGMLYGGFLMIVLVHSNNFPLQHFDYFIIIMVVALFGGAIFGTLSLYFPVGKYMTKLTLCNLLVVFVMEIFFENVTAVLLQFSLAVIFSVILVYSNVTYAAFLGGLMLILNLSYLIKVGNLHRIVVNNFLAFASPPPYIKDASFNYIRPNYINYRVSLNFIDYGLIVFCVTVSTFLTVRKERYFFEHPSLSTETLFPNSTEINAMNCENARRRRQNCRIGERPPLDQSHGQRIVSRSRRLHRIRPELLNQRSPIYTNWVTSEEGDDEVFETPQSPRYMQLVEPDHHSEDEIIEFDM